MEKTRVLSGKWFYGNEVSAYGQKHNRLDYRTLAQSFEAVLCNDITKLFWGTVDGEYCEPEQINGFVDNSEEIEELESRIEELEECCCDSEEIEELKELIEELQYQQDYPPEIYQYYIISDRGARILQEFTNDPVYYIEPLDLYIWGVTHWGTGWDYVLTDVILEIE